MDETGTDTTDIRRNAFQANRTGKVVHCRQSGPPPPPGKHALLSGSTVKKGDRQSIYTETER